jgi:predicted Zn-dependent protease
LAEREQGAVSFIHLTFQEYFAASDLYWRYRKTPDALWIEVLQPHLYDSRWLEVILLLLGRLKDDGDTPSIIVAKILCEHDKFDDVIHRDLFLAARCLADNVSVKEPLQMEITKRLSVLASIGQWHYWSLRIYAIKTLGTLRDDKHACDALLKLAQAKKQTDNAQSFAVEALSQLGKSEVTVIEVLLSLARDKKVDYDVRRIAAEELGQLGRTNDAERLLLAMINDEKKKRSLRRYAARALIRLGCSDEAVRLLLAWAQDEKSDEWERSFAVNVLGELRQADDTVVQCLLKLAQNEKDTGLVRLAATEALGYLGRIDDAIRLFLNLVQDESVVYWRRCEAVRDLVELKPTGDTVIQCLLALVHDKRINGYVRSATCGVLTKLGAEDESIQTLLEIAQDENIEDDIRCDAVSELGQPACTNSVVVQSLMNLATNQKVLSRLRRASIRALGELEYRDDIVIQPLWKMVKDKKVNQSLRIAGAKVLGRLGQKDEAVHWLLAIADDPKAKGWVQFSVAQALEDLGQTDEKVRLLLPLMKDQKIKLSLRHEAAKALSQLREKPSSQFASALLNLARHRDDRICDAAYDALEEAAGNLRYAELDTRQKRIKRKSKEIPKLKSQVAKRKSRIRNGDK